MPEYSLSSAKYARDLARHPATYDFAQSMHSIQPGSPRLLLAASARKQATSPMEWNTPEGEGLLGVRHSNPKILSIQQYQEKYPYFTDNHAGSAKAGTGDVYVADQSPGYADGTPYNRSLIANHELEHATGQSEAMPRAGRFREIPAVIGDMVFAGEEFLMREGKPLDHTFSMPSGKKHDLQWMQRQAAQHGYWSGKSMSNLIYDTPEGRAWLQQATGSIEDTQPSIHSRKPDMTPIDYGQRIPRATTDAATRARNHLASQYGNYGQSGQAFANPPPAAGVAQPSYQSTQPAASVGMSAPQVASQVQPPMAQQQSPQSGYRMQSPGVAASTADLKDPRFKTTSEMDIVNKYKQLARQQAEQRQGISNDLNGIQQRLADSGNVEIGTAGPSQGFDATSRYASQEMAARDTRDQMRGDTDSARMARMMQATGSPTYYNGIKVQPSALSAKRLSSAETGDKWGYSPEGVLRRVQPERTAAQDQRNVEYDQIQAERNTPEMVESRRKAMQNRYGLYDGGPTPLGPKALIEARRDLSPEQQQAFIQAAYAKRAATGRPVPVGFTPDTSQGSPLDRTQSVRAERADRYAQRQASRNQQQSESQQQYQQQQIMAAAMAGNPVALDLLRTNAAMMDSQAQRQLGYAKLQQDADTQRQDLSMRRDELSQARRDSTELSKLRAQGQISENDYRTKMLEIEQQSSAAKIAREQADFDQKNRPAKLQPKEDMINGMIAQGVQPNEAIANADGMYALQKIVSKADAGDKEAQIISKLPRSEMDPTKGNAERTRDFFDRLTKAFGGNASQGYKFPNVELIKDAMDVEGINSQALQEYSNVLDESLDSARHPSQSWWEPKGPKYFERIESERKILADLLGKEYWPSPYGYAGYGISPM